MVKELALDSNIAIAILNNDLNILRNLQEVDVFYLPITVCGELLFGAKNSSRATENETKYLELIDKCEIINANLLIADEYANIRKELKQRYPCTEPLLVGYPPIIDLCVISNIYLCPTTRKEATAGVHRRCILWYRRGSPAERVSKIFVRTMLCLSGHLLIGWANIVGR